MSANEFPVILVAIVGLIILLVVVGVLVASRYKVAGPNEAFIVTGRKGKEIRDVETGEVSTDLSGQKVVMGGGIFVVPFVQRLHVLDLSSRRIMIQIRGAVSGQGVKLNLDGVALVKVGGNEDSIRAAAQRFLTQQREIETFTQETLAGSLCSIVGSLTVEQIIRDRAAFAQPTSRRPRLPVRVWSLTPSRSRTSPTTGATSPTSAAPRPPGLGRRRRSPRPTPDRLRSRLGWPPSRRSP